METAMESEMTFQSHTIWLYEVATPITITAHFVGIENGFLHYLDSDDKHWYFNRKLTQVVVSSNTPFVTLNQQTTEKVVK
jgi:hypothetical protein